MFIDEKEPIQAKNALNNSFLKTFNLTFRTHMYHCARASPAQKSRGLRVVLFQKPFKGYTFFCFLSHSVGRYVFELFASETNLKKKQSVRPNEATTLLFPD